MSKFTSVQFEITNIESTCYRGEELSIDYELCSCDENRFRFIVNCDPKMPIVDTKKYIREECVKRYWIYMEEKEKHKDDLEIGDLI